jgi:hypothetical protein
VHRGQARGEHVVPVSGNAMRVQVSHSPTVPVMCREL